MIRHIYKRGFSLIEIILGLAVFLILMVSIFQYSGSLLRGFRPAAVVSFDSTFPNGLDLYRYGEPVCDIDQDVTIERQIDLSSLISTSTPITSMHYFGNDIFVFTTDSASTSQPDVFIMRQNVNVWELVISKDVGPGIQDSVLSFPYLYVANTSVNSHVKVLQIDNNAIIEVQNIKIDSLAASNSMPRRLSVFGDHLMLGAEKSNSGGELFALPINHQNGKLSLPTHSIELGGQAHVARVIGKDLLIANSADPEMRVIDNNFLEKADYDAPLTLGNGKSVLSLYPYAVLGRTLGSGELTLLDISTTSIHSIDTNRTNGSVDALQSLAGGAPNLFMALTSNADKEIQFWNVGEDRTFHLESFINLPARTTSYLCFDKQIFVAVLINERPNLIILK